jgi:hypothetical protein
MTNIDEDDEIPRTDADERRAKNLEASIELLMSLPAFAALRCRVYEETEPFLKTLKEAPCPRLQAFEWFEAHARIYAEAVTDPKTRDAYLTFLNDRLFPETQTLLLGWPHVTEVSQKVRSLLVTLEQLLRYWQNEAFARTRADTPGQPPAVTVALLQTEPVGGAIPKTEDRPAAVDAFVTEVLQQTGRKITRRDIWSAAGYTNRTQFERFQRNSPKCGPSATSSFTRVLKLDPQDFVRLLNKKRAIE